MSIVFLFRLFRAVRERRRSITELSQKNDRELLDLGIRRSDIQRLASVPTNALVANLLTGNTSIESVTRAKADVRRAL